MVPVPYLSSAVELSLLAELGGQALSLAAPAPALAPHLSDGGMSKGKTSPSTPCHLWKLGGLVLKS